MLPYADDAVKHANLAQTAAGGDDTFDTYAPMVVASANAAKSKVTLARDTALPVFGATETTIASLYLTNVVAVLTKAVNGMDANGDGVIEATAAEGGINQAYWSAQKMSTTIVAPGAPKPPATGDIGYGSIALIALAGGLVLFAGGACLYRRNRAYTHR